MLYFLVSALVAKEYQDDVDPRPKDNEIWVHSNCDTPHLQQFPEGYKKAGELQGYTALFLNRSGKQLKVMAVYVGILTHTGFVPVQ